MIGSRRSLALGPRTTVPTTLLQNRARMGRTAGARRTRASSGGVGEDRVGSGSSELALAELRVRVAVGPARPGGRPARADREQFVPVHHAVELPAFDGLLWSNVRPARRTGGSREASAVAEGLVTA